nr:cytochrome b [Hydroides elegans]UNA71672.1 cytochrome b [Hydroides elegans]
MTTYISMRKRYNFLSIISKFCYNFPCPLSLTSFWNFGSILGFLTVTQVLTGFLLSLHYVPVSNLAFDRVAHIERDVNFGWVIRSFHQVGASGLMLGMVIHMLRGIFYDSYDRTPSVWYSGAMLYVLCMAISFLGYVLPWGQMSYWGATVITNLFSVIPFIGGDIVRLAWGGYSVGDATLNRFYSFHFLLPFLMLVVMGGHLSLLHEFGSSNPLGLDSRISMVPFYPYYLYSDILGLSLWMMMSSYFVFLNPYVLSDALNYEEANPLVTPLHIKPEWYFLAYYALLRSVPSKTGGILLMVMAILFLVFLPFASDKLMLGVPNYLGRSGCFWLFVNCWVVLSWLGAMPAEEPFIMMSGLMGLFLMVVSELDSLICDVHDWYEDKSSVLSSH